MAQGQIRGLDIGRVCCWICSDFVISRFKSFGVDGASTASGFVDVFHSTVYDWSAVLNFHGCVFLEIEHCLITTWSDSCLHLESRTLYGHPVQEKSSTQSYQAPVLFCHDYQWEQCVNSKDHYRLIRGERK